MAANEAGLMMDLSQEIMEKFNAMEIKDFKDFQFKKQKNFGDVERYDEILDTIASFVEQSNFEGLPALFCNNKSMMGAPESLNELKDFIDQAVNEMQKSSQAAENTARALKQAAQLSNQLSRQGHTHATPSA
jgi:methyl-accepting chemotaxis protein